VVDRDAVDEGKARHDDEVDGAALALDPFAQLGGARLRQELQRARVDVDGLAVPHREGGELEDVGGVRVRRRRGHEQEKRGDDGEDAERHGRRWAA
jgi:hypothetical protein